MKKMAILSTKFDTAYLVIGCILLSGCLTASSTSGGKTSTETKTKQKISQKTDIKETRDIETKSIIEIPLESLMGKNNTLDEEELEELIERLKQDGKKNIKYEKGILKIISTVSAKSGSSTSQNTSAMNETLIKMKQEMQTQASSSFNMQLIILIVVGIIVIYVLFKVGIITFKTVKKVKGII